MDYIKKTWYCACTKTLCDGICKQKNLHRPRTTKGLDICPAVYEHEPTKYKRKN